jgi:hypothetical protein
MTSYLLVKMKADLTLYKYSLLNTMCITIHGSENVQFIKLIAI